MSYWLALLLAICGNIGANFAFKKFTVETEISRSWSSMLSAALHPMLWVGLTLGVMLLLSYLYALRGLPLRTAYTLATSLSIVGISSVGMIFFGEVIGLKAVLGIAFVIVGVGLLTTG
ncbi:multidrug efflux SMR transporter [Ruegeria sp. HKCCA5491]|uniref:DMT family transporter n=1 Tax=Ruegeria sp. HKCCA5491 TaxID=2682986 RepID=UPI0014894F73|nr:SMR family transporter [Ruegeria sp. HKCCA5491]